MNLTYSGPVKLGRVSAQVDLSPERADVHTEFQLENIGREALSVKLGAVEPGLTKVSVSAEPREVARPRPRDRELTRIRARSVKATLMPGQRQTLSADFSTRVFGEATKSFLFVPSLLVDSAPLMQRASEYRVSFALPKNARKLIWSSTPPAAIRQTDEGLRCDFVQHDAYALPITVKWTERDEDVDLQRSVHRGRSNRLTVTITVRNRGSEPVTGLTVEDNYAPEDVRPLSRTGFEFEQDGKDLRLVYRARVDLAPKASKTLRYVVEGLGEAVTVPATTARIGGDLIAAVEWPTTIKFSPAFITPTAAFALPSGWSFDYLHGGDHHLNEHGMWCRGQDYDSARERLSWSTGCIFADKNFDDDYNWYTAHQVLRFNPGHAHHGATPWLSKTGSTTTRLSSFRHPFLKVFNNAVVFLTGWHFNFTSSDQHINRMRMELDTTSFERSKGMIRWRTRVTYADKNFDDHFLYRYWFTILGFNGAWKAWVFTGVDKGGTAAHVGDVTSPQLKGYRSGLVIPVGWSFDYSSSDHHINEHNFKIQNVRYTKSSGRFRWTTHLNYSDRNFDDDYSWAYRVVLIATNDGEGAEYSKGPYKDDGGLAHKSFSVRLDSLLKPITWTNGVKDGDETGVDCGGSSPARNMYPIKSRVNPGRAASSTLYSLRKSNDQNVVKTFATAALLEYAQLLGQDFADFYSGPEKPDRYVEAIAWYVEEHMAYVADSGYWRGAQTALKTLTQSGYRGGKDFAGDCEDFAILRAALLRSLGFSYLCIFCADHHNSVDQGQGEECYDYDGKKKSRGHTFNIVVYKGKYRILDYGIMQNRYWSSRRCWAQNAVDNIWNDHTGRYWSRKDVSPFGDQPLVNYPGKPSSPTPNWDWRTYYCDITP